MALSERSETEGLGYQGTSGPQDQETGGLGDQWTKGPRDQGTKGPVDQGTTLPEDPQTTRPGEQQKRPIKEYLFFDSLFFFDPVFIFLMLFLFLFDTHAPLRGPHYRDQGLLFSACFVFLSLDAGAFLDTSLSSSMVTRLFATVRL